ncbi:hypothetical protein ACFC18_33830 [Streptomyces sp. NPDC056121]|uniref:hypothetical protein n=1 Tax=Streptomyces TaxID=1883 RepID=UPI001D0AB7D0|nr:hypothetical protein [Streptomyces longhuiensis]UDL97045.1 hypothetical protein LGI35_01465 [Streptomyces longhuiensis]
MISDVQGPATHTAETAVDLHRPLLAAHATGNVRLLDGQLAVKSPEPRLALALPHARVARAGDIADGDPILAALCAQGTDYFNTPYSAHPEPVVRLRRVLPHHSARRGGRSVLGVGRPAGARHRATAFARDQAARRVHRRRPGGAGGGRSTAGRAVIDLTE